MLESNTETKRRIRAFGDLADHSMPLLFCIQSTRMPGHYLPQGRCTHRRNSNPLAQTVTRTCDAFRWFAEMSIMAEMRFVVGSPEFSSVFVAQFLRRSYRRSNVSTLPLSFQQFRPVRIFPKLTYCSPVTS